jgi:hypothetical protein
MLLATLKTLLRHARFFSNDSCEFSAVPAPFKTGRVVYEAADTPEAESSSISNNATDHLERMAPGVHTTAEVLARSV